MGEDDRLSGMRMKNLKALSNSIENFTPLGKASRLMDCPWLPWRPATADPNTCGRIAGADQFAWPSTPGSTTIDLPSLKRTVIGVLPVL